MNRPALNISFQGFTLIEILIAVFILSLILSTVYISYTGTLTHSRQLEEEGTIYEMARVALDRLMKDLSSLQKTNGSFDLQADKKKSGAREFHAMVFRSAAHLAFTENEQDNRPATIRYFVREEDSGKGFSLWRADAMESQPDSPFHEEDGFVICRNIEAFRLTFYDETGQEFDTWHASSSEQNQGRAPHIIQIELVLANPSNPSAPYPFMTKLFLPVKEETP